MYKTGFRWLVMGLTGLLLSVGLVGVSPTTAMAVGCVGASCDNKGPVSMGCNKDGRAISNPAYTDERVIYSPACRAVWASSYAPPLTSCVYVQIEKGYYNHDHNLVVAGRISQQLCPGEAGDWTNMFGVPPGWYFRAVWNDPAGPDGYCPWVYQA